MAFKMDNPKKILVWAAVIIFAIFSLGIIKDQLIKGAVTVTASAITGAPVHIDGLSLGIFSQRAKIAGFKMYNPRGFSRSILVELPKIYVAFDLGALFGGKLHLPNLEIELKELGLEKNKEGGLNVDSLKVVKQGEKQKAQAPSQMSLRIDTLKLGMGRIVSKDYSAPGEPVVSVYDININKGYKNITSAQQLAALILAEPMKAAGIQGARIYGVSMLAGVAVLPVAAAFTFAGKDSASGDFGQSFERVYEEAEALLRQKGQLKRIDKGAGVLTASVNSVDVAVRIIRKSGHGAQVVISARKYLLPKPAIASGLLYELSEKFK